MTLDAGLTGAMATLVSASVFSIGFLSTRVHQAAQRATDRATEIDDRLVEGRDFAPAWLEKQREVLGAAVSDQFPKLVERATYVFAGLLVIVAAVAAADAGLNIPNLTTLAALLAAEATILIVGIEDRGRVEKELARRLGDTLLKRMEEGVKALNLANPRFGHAERGASAEKARAIGKELQERTGGAWLDAAGLVALAELALLLDGAGTGGQAHIDELTERFADLALRDPENHVVLAGGMRMAELRGDWDAAGTAWAAAESLPHRRRAEWSGRPASLTPASTHTLERALEELEQQERLHDDAARRVFGQLVSAARAEASGDAPVPTVVATWLERIAQAIIAKRALGFDSAEVFLQAPEPFGVEWPALRAVAADLRERHVAPAKQEYERQWRAVLDDAPAG